MQMPANDKLIKLLKSAFSVEPKIMANAAKVNVKEITNDQFRVLMNIRVYCRELSIKRSGSGVVIIALFF